MNNRKFSRYAALVVVMTILILIFCVGCGVMKPVGRFYDNFTAQYNTYYNVKKNFGEAEKVTRQNLRTQTDPNSPPTVPISLYQNVIASGASLLEYYPECRWIDDTLILMGISYYRLSEYGRAERKFSELVTIFPASEHAPSATVWRARSIVKQGRLDEAETGLSGALSHFDRDEDIADAQRVLASIYFQQKLWKSATEYYALAAPKIQNREEQCEAWYNMGEAYIALEDYANGRDVLSRVIDRSKMRMQAYNASILWSRCALKLGDAGGAERILEKLKSEPAFASKKSAIDVEIAAIAIATGQVDRGIELYQEFINTSPSSEEKGLAYYRLGEVYRDVRADLAMSRAKFDSVNSSGASRSLIDSARVATDNLSKGLVAIARLGALRDSLSAADAALDSLKAIDWSVVQSEDSAPDSGNAKVDTLLHVDAAVADTASHRPITPATLLADSLLKALQASAIAQASDSIAPDSSLQVERVAEPETVVSAEMRALAAIARLDSSREVLRESIMSTYLRIAEFFEENLHEPDSSLKYLTLAAAELFSHDDFWKACLQLAARLEKSEPTDSIEVRRLYERALAVETMPLSVQNVIRNRLGYEIQGEEIAMQDRMLADAEAAFLTESVSIDSVLAMYGDVVKADSTSTAALKALFGLEYIYEFRLNDFESAKHVTQTIINLFPDSSFVTSLQVKVAEPNSSSIFDLTDEQIAEARAKSHVVLSVQPDSTGWPPPEESLKGRRFR